MNFYDKFALYLSNLNINQISYNHMMDFAENEGYGDWKEKRDIIDSISMFWTYYSPYASVIPKTLMVEYVNQLRNELEFGFSDRIDFCEDTLTNIDDGLHVRTNHYKNSGDLFDKLDSCGMHEEDIEISLDAYDYSLILNCQIDFITFDKECFNCVSRENMCFNKVKCYKNYGN